MKGQVFTIAKLHYVNGVVYHVAERKIESLQAIADDYKETTPSGAAKYPIVRVRTLTRFAVGLGLLELDANQKVSITKLGQRYYSLRANEKWILSPEQKELLRNHILSDSYRTETIYAICALLKLVKSGYSGMDLAKRYSVDIGKETAWKSDVTFKGFTKFGLDYIDELGFAEVDDAAFFIKELEADQRYQESANEVAPIEVPSGMLPRPEPRKLGNTERYFPNARRSRKALDLAGYRCAFGDGHETFTHRRTGRPYMEAHHLIPMQKQGMMKHDIDVPENILCLCPNCHRKIHFGEDRTRGKMLLAALSERSAKLAERGIGIDREELAAMYGISSINE